MDQSHAEKLHDKLSKGENISIFLTNDHNTARDPVESGAFYAFSAISMTISLVILFLASLRLYQFIAARGWVLSLNNVLFCLDGFAAIRKNI